MAPMIICTRLGLSIFCQGGGKSSESPTLPLGLIEFVEGERDIFFGGVATGRLPVLLEITLTGASRGNHHETHWGREETDCWWWKRTGEGWVGRERVMEDNHNQNPSQTEEPCLPLTTKHPAIGSIISSLLIQSIFSCPQLSFVPSTTWQPLCSQPPFLQHPAWFHMEETSELQTTPRCPHILV